MFIDPGAGQLQVAAIRRGSDVWECGRVTWKGSVTCEEEQDGTGEGGEVPTTVTHGFIAPVFLGSTQPLQQCGFKRLFSDLLRSARKIGNTSSASNKASVCQIMPFLLQTCLRGGRSLGEPMNVRLKLAVQ